MPTSRTRQHLRNNPYDPYRNPYGNSMPRRIPNVKPYRDVGDTVVRGMLDVSKIAIVGGVTVGIVGALGSMFPRG